MINFKKHIKTLLLILVNLFLLLLLLMGTFLTEGYSPDTIRIFGHNCEKQLIYSILFNLFFIFLSFLVLKKICFTIQSKPIKIILYFINYVVDFFVFIFIFIFYWLHLL